ncbi:hypothetical protein OE88DRAFT_254306 [Heliocybe sulcata]|uniref:Uncharacterized protein n=1 Tax=Heliocybe sulcata TaxID=5364 RepID=A0A5C3N074_9AGAM|nr:hypothetical protein OE88DRAFT_254306 [Heliocybe sulcata]
MWFPVNEPNATTSDPAPSLTSLGAPPAGATYSPCGITPNPASTPSTILQNTTPSS